MPNPTKATWLAVVFPGGGQIYNRKYWKLPIIYGGFAGCAYALSWNGKMYKDYAKAYLDIMDSNPNTKSYEDLLPPNAQYNEEQLKNTLKRRKDSFRRFRDLSIFAFIGVYLISIIDAYVDAELSNFDISPDLSMKLEPRQKKYFEVGSCSNLGDAQARRLGIRVKAADGSKYFAHTLNNTVVAPPRMLIAFLENNLRFDGEHYSVLIPEALRPYMGGKTVLTSDKKL